MMNTPLGEGFSMPFQPAADLDEVRLKDVSTGTRWVHRGRGLLFLEPTWRIENSVSSSGIQKSWGLRGREFLR